MDLRRPAFFLYRVFPAVLVGLMSVVAIALVTTPGGHGIAIWGPIQPETLRACRAEARGDSVAERMHGAQMLRFIGEICPSTSSTIAADLVALLRDPDLRVRVQAIEALGAIGPAAEGAADALRAVRGSTHRYVDLIVDAAVYRIESGVRRPDDAELCSLLQGQALLVAGQGVEECKFRPMQPVE